jgi:hypothetical protein
MADEDDLAEEEPPLDPRVTPALFREWRSPRFGEANPERMDNLVWEWLIKSKLSAYQATQRLQESVSGKDGAGWCFRRFGRSATLLADRRTVLIAGEHEDFYDPDFYIYNDVVVRHPDGRIEIFGYPREIFPPTDFHSATLVGNRIVIVGGLGYRDARQPGTTPVYILDLASFAISAVQTTGTPPGWLCQHQAILSEDGTSLIIRGGLLERAVQNASSVEKIEDWQLGLADWRWKKLTDRQWPRWEVRRKDGKQNHLFHFVRAAWDRDYPQLRSSHTGLWQSSMQSLTELLGAAPDLHLFDQLFKPGIPHSNVPSSKEEFRVHRIEISGVIVRYVEGAYSIQITVEGDLPTTTMQTITSDLLGKFSALENTPSELQPL